MSDSKRELKPCPLPQKWRYSNNYLFCGTLRISRWDIDTAPSQEFKDELGEWMAERLNSRPTVSKEDLENAFKHGYEFGHHTPKEEWISVKELPANGKRVLLRAELQGKNCHGEIVHFDGWWSKKKECFYDWCGDQEGLDDFLVTHWMHLPSPPPKDQTEKEGDAPYGQDGPFKY